MEQNVRLDTGRYKNERQNGALSRGWNRPTHLNYVERRRNLVCDTYTVYTYRSTSKVSYGALTPFLPAPPTTTTPPNSTPTHTT